MQCGREKARSAKAWNLPYYLFLMTTVLTTEVIDLWRAAACLVALLTLSACGAPTSPAPLTASLSGQWTGAIDSPVDGPGSITLDLTQTGLNVSGSVLLSQGGISDVRGTLSGTVAVAASTTLDYTVRYEFGDHCQGTFSGTCQVAGTDMAGAYEGDNCAQHFSGVLHVTKGNK
jgi:hypothetical protein